MGKSRNIKDYDDCEDCNFELPKRKNLDVVRKQRKIKADSQAANLISTDTTSEYDN